MRKNWRSRLAVTVTLAVPSLTVVPVEELWLALAPEDGTPNVTNTSETGSLLPPVTLITGGLANFEPVAALWLPPEGATMVRASARAAEEHPNTRRMATIEIQKSHARRAGDAAAVPPSAFALRVGWLRRLILLPFRMSACCTELHARRNHWEPMP